jgi:hypothetical protein
MDYSSYPELHEVDNSIDESTNPSSHPEMLNKCGWKQAWNKINYLQALLESYECLVPGHDARTKNAEGGPR